MSSKEQYKDALKSKNRIIAEQGLKISEQFGDLLRLDKENHELRQLNRQLKNQLSTRKKWWQFWK